MARRRSSVNRSEPLHLQVARNIRNDIESGRLRDGQLLPSTRELAEEWGVSTPVISDAMAILSNEGLVETKPRVGRVVRAPQQASTRPDDPSSSTPQAVAGRYDRGMAATLEELEARIAALEADRADYRAVLAAINALGANQREHADQLRTLSQHQADTNTRVRAVDDRTRVLDDRTRSMEENLAEVKDLLVRALER